MRNLLLSLLAALPLTACGSTQNFDPVPLVLTAVQGGEIVSSILAQNALESEAWEACVAATVTGAVLGAAQEALVDQTELPALGVDVSDCLIFNPDFEAGDSTLPSVSRPIEAAISTLITIDTFLNVWGDELCEKIPAIFVVYDYLEAAVPEILAEILAPDGIVSVPAISLTPDTCD